jgi:hypothetical protein
MSLFGQAQVKNGRYKIKGDFHSIQSSTPIRNADNNNQLIGITNPRQLIHLHSYGGEAPFFEALSKGKLLATRCDNQDCEYCSTIYQPFRIHCPDCLAKCTIIDMTDTARKTGRVHTFMTCERSGAFNTLDKPIRFINIEFEGITTILMSYLIVGEAHIGDRVLPVFRMTDPTYTITDLAWVTKGTGADQLPAGFSF